ncbi:MAG: PD-(D/E)XK nuclease family protein [Varibaculum cambriense]|uniref:RecB family exonuclease n=1 Tax=Varibaculum cambriense TaxID=184870 RepID=UPI00241D855C|nr:PD-(D/E)XK nuclease family protein [Varibaculum cambriense]MBS5962678.1 PD-(D/E)XK nuclease family protein [Varibaculum cambriense]MBS5972647.1 PD-(D/E)XK nuclease family protein [Varibaculum cambriense]
MSISKRASALSPSRIGTFRNCPLQFRFQVIDKIPTKESQVRQRGTLVHAALENLFDLPAQQRTFAAASRKMEEAWDKTLSEKPDLLAELFGEDKSGESQFLETARQLLANYFQMENPDRLAPAHREKYLRVTDKNHLHLHGYIDRVDISPTGLVRIVDYKTGKAPAERYIGPYQFQIRFYALLWYLTQGQLPARLQLLFLKDRQVYTYTPTAADIDATTEEILAVWEQILTQARSGYFPPRRSPLCNWCDYRAYCPLMEGIAPEISDEGVQRLLSTQEDGAQEAEHLS